MFRWRVRLNGRFARKQDTALRDAWATLLLNCPVCGRHLAPRVNRTTCVFACVDHGEWFVSGTDGRLRDASKVKR
jgi:hypothetical protein